MPTFYQREHPADHFRTGAQRDGTVPEALAELVRQCAAELDATSSEPQLLDVVDVGAGDGSLLEGVMNTLARIDPELAARCRPVGVDLRPRPPELSARIDWIVGAAPESLPEPLVGVLIAHELLDDVPLEVLQCDDDGGLRDVLVDPSNGRETLGNPASDDALEWSRRWWPWRSPGERIEVGAARDDMWAALTLMMERGVAVAIDYAHTREERACGEHRLGTLMGYRNGRSLPPVPDGTMNVTAHVALDACAAAAQARAASRECHTRMMSQRDAINALLPDAGPAPMDASPRGTLEEIGRRSRRAEASDATGLGRFTWLVHSFGVAPPASIR
jgi:SAM-dependent MidA family methyltransferase